MTAHWDPRANLLLTNRSQEEINFRLASFSSRLADRPNAGSLLSSIYIHTREDSGGECRATPAKWKSRATAAVAHTHSHSVIGVCNNWPSPAGPRRPTGCRPPSGARALGAPSARTRRPSCRPAGRTVGAAISRRGRTRQTTSVRLWAQCAPKTHQQQKCATREWTTVGQPHSTDHNNISCFPGQPDRHDDDDDDDD